MKLRIKANVGRFLMLVSLALLTGTVLSAQDVRYNFMPGTDFAKYHTYKWVPGSAHPRCAATGRPLQAVQRRRRA
jgi:hypothetical protein